MGLDNGFVVKFKDKKELNIAYFRKYYELRNYIENNCSQLTGSPLGYSEYLITPQCIDKLLATISPIYNILNLYDKEELAYFEDAGFPEDWENLFDGNYFNPIESMSAFPCNKLIHLYYTCQSLIEIFDENDNQEFQIYFYSSF